MGKEKCETCDNYEANESRPHTGTCWKDGAIVDEKGSCWWHTSSLLSKTDNTNDTEEEKEEAPE